MPSDVSFENGLAGTGTGAPSTGGSVKAWIVDNWLVAVSVVLVIVLAFFCFVGPTLYRTNQTASVLALANLRPSSRFPLGTDNNGFNILGRLMLGGQLSLEIGLAVAVMSTTFGAVWGAVAGWFGGVVDTVMMRTVDALLAVPWVFLYLFFTSIVRPTTGLIIVVLASLSWLVPSRLARAETLSLRSREFVDAARVAGAGAVRVVFRHLLPNTLGTIVVNATFQVADAISALALLSYLGFGPPPPVASWGGMLSNGVNFLYDGYWWQVYPAGVMILVTVLAFNFLGDGLRDLLDVRRVKR